MLNPPRTDSKLFTPPDPISFEDKFNILSTFFLSEVLIQLDMSVMDMFRLFCGEAGAVITADTMLDFVTEVIVNFSKISLPSFLILLGSETH